MSDDLEDSASPEDQSAEIPQQDENPDAPAERRSVRASNLAGGRPFPNRTLEQALRIPRALKQFNAGNEWDPKEVAAALGIGPGSGNYYYLTAASRDHGLTLGTRDTASIKLTDLGRRAVYPGSDEEESEALREAFFKVDVFRSVLEYYKGSTLPERRFLTNTLQTTFGIDPAYHDKFIEIFQKDCRFLGIGDYTPGERPSTRLRTMTSSPESASSVVLAEPPAKKGAATPVCFVIMPFTERDDRHLPGFFDEVLANLFIPAATKAGFEVKTAKRQGSDVIQSTIVNELLEADLVLADLTEHNPNVLFELGVRMAEDKPVVLVRAKGTGAIFDVDSMLRVEEYSPSLWKSTIERDVPRLADHLNAAWLNRDSNPTFMKILRRDS
jgi:hypothetical protein